MAPDDARPHERRYSAVLSGYLANHSESELYQASLLSQEMAFAGLGPDEIVALHMEAVADLTADEGTPAIRRIRALEEAQQFLLEVMIGYGVYYKQHADLIVEERQRAEREAAREVRERAELLAAIAHEFGTPLTVSIGHVQRARRLLDRGRLDEGSDSIEEVATSLDRLRHLLANLHYASRSGDLPTLDLVPCDLDAFVAESCSWVLPDAERKQIAIEVDVDVDEPVLAEAEALRTIISNVLSNAVRYSRTGGRVTLRARRDESAPQARIEVRDDGIGMSEETRARIFEPFFRAPEAQTAARQGLGLGLAITARFVQALSGEIHVESAPGEGSCFIVTLPLAHASGGEYRVEGDGV